MLAKRIIPCLDIRNGMTVKGINFENVVDVGDPVELGAKYALDGADELVYLDITATHEGRKLFADLVGRIAQHLNIPFTVGGGINHISDAEVLLSAGADKVSINSSAVRNPELIDQIAGGFGNQFVVVAIDAHWKDQRWTVFVNGGRISTDKELFSWAL
ncbi:MAG: HisA/HisF-related TIM barrel protein, partial [Bacteroidales bacterium]